MLRRQVSRALLCLALLNAICASPAVSQDPRKRQFNATSGQQPDNLVGPAFPAIQQNPIISSLVEFVLTPLATPAAQASILPGDGLTRDTIVLVATPAVPAISEILPSSTQAAAAMAVSSSTAPSVDGPRIPSSNDQSIIISSQTIVTQDSFAAVQTSETAIATPGGQQTVTSGDTLVLSATSAFLVQEPPSTTQSITQFAATSLMAPQPLLSLPQLAPTSTLLPSSFAIPTETPSVPPPTDVAAPLVTQASSSAGLSSLSQLDPQPLLSFPVETPSVPPTRSSFEPLATFPSSVPLSAPDRLSIAPSDATTSEDTRQVTTTKRDLNLLEKLSETPVPDPQSSRHIGSGPAALSTSKSEPTSVQFGLQHSAVPVSSHHISLPQLQSRLSASAVRTTRLPTVAPVLLPFNPSGSLLRTTDRDPAPSPSAETENKFVTSRLAVTDSTYSNSAIPEPASTLTDKTKKPEHTNLSLYKHKASATLSPPVSLPPAVPPATVIHESTKPDHPLPSLKPKTEPQPSRTVVKTTHTPGASHETQDGPALSTTRKQASPMPTGLQGQRQTVHSTPLPTDSRIHKQTVQSKTLPTEIPKHVHSVPVPATSSVANPHQSSLPAGVQLASGTHHSTTTPLPSHEPSRLPLAPPVWLPAVVQAQPNKTADKHHDTSIAPSSTPAALPQAVVPATPLPPLQDLVLGRIGFKPSLSWDWVATQAVTQAQLINFLPLLINEAVPGANAALQHLKPGNFSGKTITMAYVYVSANKQRDVQGAIANLASAFYCSPSESFRSLSDQVDSTVPFIIGEETTTTPASPGSSMPPKKKGGSGRGSTDGGLANVSGSDKETESDKQTSSSSNKPAIIGVSAMGAASAYLGIMFLIMRHLRLRRARQLQSIAYAGSRTNGSTSRFKDRSVRGISISAPMDAENSLGI